MDAYGMVCHVGKKSHRTKFINYVKEKFGRIDILSFNAGVGFYVGEFLE